MKKYIFLFLLLFLSACSADPSYIEYSPQNPYEEQKIEWVDYDPSIFVSQKDSRKPAFLFFESKKCQACLKVKNTLFKDSLIAKNMSEGFLTIRVEENNLDFEKLSIQFKINSVPHFVILAYPNYEKVILEGNSFNSIITFEVLLDNTKNINALIDMSETRDSLFKRLLERQEN